MLDKLRNMPPLVAILAFAVEARAVDFYHSAWADTLHDQPEWEEDIVRFVAGVQLNPEDYDYFPYEEAEAILEADYGDNTDEKAD